MTLSYNIKNAPSLMFRSSSTLTNSSPTEAQNGYF
jgi:hypothetical protein